MRTETVDGHLEDGDILHLSNCARELFLIQALPSAELLKVMFRGASFTLRLKLSLLRLFVIGSSDTILCDIGGIEQF